MLANIYLHVLDSYWENHKELGIIVRYADDAVIVCRTRKDMRQPFEYCGKKIVGKPCEGESHARFEVAGDGNGNTAPSLDPTSHGYLPPSVMNHKPVSVMVWMEEVV